MVLHRQLAAVAATCALVGALAGCGFAESSPAPPDIPSDVPAEAGGGGGVAQAESQPCYGFATSEGPFYDTVVDCTEPHVGEVFAVLDQPPGSPERRSAYAGDGAAARSWRAWADPACADALRTAAGGEVYAAAMGLPRGTLVVPDWQATYGYSLTPAEEWAAGVRQTVCTARTTENEAVAGEWVATSLGPDRAPELAICEGYDGDSTTYVGCDEQHYRELTFRFDAAALGPRFVEELDPARPTAAQYALMDGACDRAERALLGRERDDLKVLASVPSTFGDGGYTLVSCGIQPQRRDRDAVGSALGIGDDTLRLVPAEQ